MSQAIAPFRLPYYRAVWVAALFSNVGSFLQTVAAAWLMKELTDSSATWVGLMLASNLLPLLFLSLISGVVADTVDRTKVMLIAQSLMGSAAAAMAILTATDLITPGLLLGLGLLMGVGVAFNLPAWQALVPDLVPRGMVASAVALNSAGFNVARAVGPALGGLIVATAGPQLGFGLNAISYLAVITVIAVVGRRLRLSAKEHTSMTNAIAQSIRYARFTPAFRRLLGLVALFAITSAVVQATLPNRTSELGGSETTYGILLGFMGAGALVGALVRPRVVATLGGRSVPTTIVVFGVAGITVGLAPSTAVAALGMMLAGASWVLTLTTVNASSQLMAPEWIRGRAMSLYTLAFSGIYPIGSILSGALADVIGAGSAMVAFSGAALVLGLLAPRFRLPSLAEIHTPEYTEDRPAPPHVDTEGGPVMIANTWQIDRADLEDFVALMSEIRKVRLRTGAYRWRLYRNSEDPHRITEVFVCVSWEEHLAQHRRIDDASAQLIRRARSFDRDGGPRTRHLVAVDVDHPEWEPLIAAHDQYHRTDGSIPLNGG
jgi:MFS family permease